MFGWFGKKKGNCITEKMPQDLPGVRKASFALPYNGGEIWFEHLDGMYQYTELVKEKLMRDSAAFLRPSASSVLAVVMFDTLITDELVSLLAELLCGRGKMFRRVCLIGADRNVQEKLDRALWGKHSFSYCFLNDTEAAKEWLLP